MKAVFFFLLCLTVSVQAAEIESVLKRSRIPLQHFGIWIEAQPEPLTYNASKAMIPASLSKIPTEAAVLAELGLGYQFETKIWTTGKIIDGVLQGDIYLQGGGDPALVSENYWMMINELKRTGLRSIQGKLYVDNSLFDEEHFSDSRQSVRVDRAYDAPVSALSFNWNSVNVFVRPTLKGQPAAVFADPKNDYIELQNKVVTGSKTDLRVERRSQKKSDVIVVAGTIASDASEQVVYKSITHPEYWAGENFKAFLNQQSVDYKGGVEVRRVPPEAQLVVTFKSKSLREIVTDMAKFSNNYVAEMLTKALSTQKPATLKSGVKRIQQWLEKKGWKSQNYVFTNPSGFSHDNKFRAEDLGSLLVELRKDFTTFPEMWVSLPVAGIDGTLKKRLKDKPALVRGKTGYLDGIIGLAGYFSNKGEPRAFVFMYNGPTSYDSQVRDVYDELVRDVLLKN